MSVQLDQLLREADPAAGPMPELDGADRILLEEIVATPPVDPRALANARRRRRMKQLTMRSRLLVPVIGAAVIGAAVAIPAALHEEPAAPPATAPSAVPQDDPSLPVTQVDYAAAAVRVARANPRLLVTADGWAVRSVGGFSPTSGEMTFQLGPDRWVYSEMDANGDVLRSMPIPDPDSAPDQPGEGVSMTGVDNEAPQVSVDWYPKDQYAGYRADRATESVAAERVLGQRLDVVAYSDDDHAFMLPPEGRVFLEVRGSHLSRAEFLALINDHSGRVPVNEWLAAMPPEVVTAENAGSRLEQVLAGVPTPPGFKGADLGKQAALDSYQFGATVAGVVVCGWVQEWERARAADDQPAVAAATAALATSHDWKFLQDMDAEGDYPEVVWEIADQVSAGEHPEGYRGALGCS